MQRIQNQEHYECLGIHSGPEFLQIIRHYKSLVHVVIIYLSDPDAMAMKLEHTAVLLLGHICYKAWQPGLGELS